MIKIYTRDRKWYLADDVDNIIQAVRAWLFLEEQTGRLTTQQITSLKRALGELWK